MKLTIIADEMTAQALAGAAGGAPTQNAAGTAIVPVRPSAEDKAQVTGPVKRDALGRIIAGSGALNPGGRRAGLRTIMSEVVDFRAVISMVASIAYGPLAPAARMNDRLKAAELLLAYQFGKPHQTLDVTEGKTGAANVRSMSSEQLTAFRETLRKSLTNITDAELVEPE